MHEYLATAPFDLYELHLFRLIARHGSFTRAARAAGLTQSALTRQIQGMEQRVGVRLLERTTRRVAPTPAGEFLLSQSGRLVGDVESILRHLREQFAGARPEIRVGISRSVSLAYLPGFFHANLRAHPEIACRVSYAAGMELLARLEAGELDLAVLSLPARLAAGVRVTHRFADAFTLIASPEAAEAVPKKPRAARAKHLRAQPWLLLHDQSRTGALLQAWLKKQALWAEPVMQLDSFDLIINLVVLGMGVSLVPMRALALYGKRRAVQRLPWPDRYTREVGIVTRRFRQIPPHLAAFLEGILF
jgi:DNA-binding transcriptional LysR family regulator